MTRKRIDRDALGEVEVDPTKSSSHRCPGVRRRGLDRPTRKMIGKDPVAEDLVHGSGEIGRIAARNPQTGAAVIDEGAESTDIGCHDRNTAGRRFQRHEPERLAA